MDGMSLSHKKALKMQMHFKTPLFNRAKSSTIFIQMQEKSGRKMDFMQSAQEVPGTIVIFLSIFMKITLFYPKVLFCFSTVI